MIDLHCHLLPGVDDGAQNDSDSIALFKIAIADGITHMTLTPHVQPGRYENTRNNLLPHFEKLQTLLKEQQLDINIAIAGEVRLCAEVLGLYTTQDLPFIGKLEDKSVMLLELPHEGIPPGSDKLVDWLMDRNILPMIVHPERNKAVRRDITKIAPFIEKGCLFQLTAMSITRKFGEPAYNIAHQFLNNGWASIVASDAHNTNRRPPILSEAYDTVSKQYNNDLANSLFIDTPKQIISAL
jgi:protein-tyrosine phosphatase